MPQLDMVTFFPQFFWFCLFFTGFYLTLVQKYLPQLTRIFAVREAAQQTTPTDLTTDACEALAQKTHKVFSDSVQETKKKIPNKFKKTDFTYATIGRYHLLYTVCLVMYYIYHILPGFN